MDAMGTNSSPAINYSDLPTTSFRSWVGNTSTANGKKIGLPVSAIADLGNKTGRPIWICVPHQFTDAAITSLATDLRNLCGSKIYVEYSNEVWNSAFGQFGYTVTQAAGSGTGLNNYQWTGLRAAQVMEIFRTVYGQDSGGPRWVGVLGTQTVFPGVTTYAFDGIDYHIAHDAGAASTTTQLFTHLAVANYFGLAVANAKKTFTPANIDTTGNKLNATLIGNGQLGDNTPVTFSTDGTLPAPLNTSTTYYVRDTVGADAIQFSLTSGGSAIDLTTTGSGNSYMLIEPGITLSNWADVSQAYFNQQLYDQLKDSAAASATWGNIAQNRLWWQAQMALSLRGLTVICYEGGASWQTALPLLVNGILETEGTKINTAFAYFCETQYAADLHTQCFNAFLAEGGTYPSKFVDIRQHYAYGPWGAANNFSDLNDLTYQACRSWNR